MVCYHFRWVHRESAICRKPIGFNSNSIECGFQRDLPEFVYLAVTADYFRSKSLLTPLALQPPS